MQAVIEHLQTAYVYYVGGIVLLLPLIIIFRKHALPMLLFTVETLVYIFAMHYIFGGIVRAGAWFKGETSMQAVREREAAPDWTTPLDFMGQNFWQKDLYEPNFLIFVELGLAIVIIFLVIRFRPAKLKRRPSRKKSEIDPAKLEAIRKARQNAGRSGYGPED